MRSIVNMLAFAGIWASVAAQQTNVLFIGNSYTYVNDLPNTLRQLALSLGDTVDVASSAPGGFTFQMHSTYAPTLTAINSQQWNYVVMQEQSQIPSFPQAQVATDCYPYAAQLVDTILANDSCTQPVFYMTWGRENGDTINCPSWPPVCTYAGMQAQLRMSYLHMADTNAAFCSPVGVAWKRVRETHPSINLYSPDQSHPSAEGTYLAACVFYSTLFRASSVGALFVSSLPADTAAILQAIASSTVLDSLATWNIGVNDPNAGFTLTLIDNCTWQLHPNEQGTQFWDFGGGDTSHATEPAHFSFVASGYQSVVHTITNACGLTSTLDSTYLVCSEGIAEHPISDHIHVKQDNAMITFSGLVETDDILITDALGRTIYRRTTVNGTLVLECPPGLTIWRVTDREGRSITGRIIIP